MNNQIVALPSLHQYKLRKMLRKRKMNSLSLHQSKSKKIMKYQMLSRLSLKYPIGHKEWMQRIIVQSRDATFRYASKRWKIGCNYETCRRAGITTTLIRASQYTSMRHQESCQPCEQQAFYPSVQCNASAASVMDATESITTRTLM